MTAGAAAPPRRRRPSRARARRNAAIARHGFLILACLVVLVPIAYAVIASFKDVPEFFAKTLEAAELYGIKHEMLSASEIRKKFPQFAVQDDETAYYEYEAGFLRPERCVRAQLELAKSHGAELHTGAAGEAVPKRVQFLLLHRRNPIAAMIPARK